MLVYEAVAAALARQEPKLLFGLIGDGNMLYIADFVAQRGGTYVAVVDERDGVAMARGYAAASGTVGVVSVTHGPGFTHAYTAVVDACRARTPMVVLTATTPSIVGHGQAIELAAVVAPTGAGYRRVLSPALAPQAVGDAVRAARYESRPIVLDVPADLLERDCGQTTPASGTPAYSRQRPDPEAVDAALAFGLGARRPVILAGRGAVLAGARAALVELAERLGAALATTLLAKDYFRGCAANLGVSGTVASTRGLGYLASADCVLAFGASLNRFTADEGELFRGRRIVQVDHDISRIDQFTPTDCAVIGDARAVAEAMLERLDDVGEAARPRRSFDLPPEPDAFTDRSTAEFIDLRTAMVMLDRMLPAQRNLVTDVGRAMRTAWRYLTVDDPMGFAHTANFGSIGLGVGTAIGVALARPDRVTVVVVGDGGFMQGLPELRTAVRLSLPLVVVVADDAAYGAEWTKLAAHGADPEHSRSDWPDFVELARAYGARGVRVSNVAEMEQLGPALGDRPLVIDVRIDPAVA